MSKQKIITIIICCITIALVITSAIVISGRFKQNNIPSNNDASIQGINQCDLSIIKEDGENKIFNYTKAFDLESLENETMQVQTTNGLITHIKISGNALVSKTEQEKFDLIQDLIKELGTKSILNDNIQYTIFEGLEAKSKNTIDVSDMNTTTMDIRCNNDVDSEHKMSFVTNATVNFLSNETNVVIIISFNEQTPIIMQ